MKKIINKINLSGMYYFPNIFSKKEAERFKNKLEKIYEKRKKIYELAHYEIDCNKISLKEITNKIINFYEKY